jgi:protein SCO1/2
VTSRRSGLRATLALAALAGFAAAQATGPIAATDGVAFDQRLGARVPFDLAFTAEDGGPVTLREIAAGKPTILALVYFSCPMLCTEVLNGLVRSLRAVPLDAGADFRVVCLSIDPREDARLASLKKASYLESYGRDGADEGFRFLVGDEASIRRVADAVGYRYRYDAASDTYAHAAGIVVLTPAGVVSRYVFGVDYPPRDVRLALVDSAGERIGTLADRLLLLCFHYDPATGKYGFAIRRVLQASGAVTVLAIAFAIYRMSRKGAGRGPSATPASDRSAATPPGGS